MESNGNTPSNSVSSEAQERHNEFWPKQMELIRNMKNKDFKTQELPLARIKKIMKLDEDVKMISAEAPVLFSKAAEIFIAELSLRAWLHTEENKRRTLQRNDIAMAITKYDQFDFLIDIVPRDELKPPKRQEGQVQQATMMPDQVQYYFQLAQNQQVTTPQIQQQSTTQQSNSTATVAAGGTGQTTPQPGQQILVTTPSGQQQYITIAAPNQASTSGQTQQVQTVTVSNNDSQVQLIANQGNQATAAGTASTAVPVQLQAAQGTNIQQVVTNTGEVQQVQLSPQIQYVRQTQGGQQGNQAELGQTVYQIQQVPIQTQSGQVTQQVFLQQPAGGDASSGATGTTQVQLAEQT